MIRIDQKLALELLRKVVEDKGAGWVDPNSADGTACQYVDIDTNTPSCIVGHVMVAAGLGAAELDYEDDVFGLAQQLRFKGTADLSGNAISVLMAAQSRQDHGDNWGEALEEAEDWAV